MIEIMVKSQNQHNRADFIAVLPSLKADVMKLIVTPRGDWFRWR